MIKICEKLKIVDYSESAINEALDMCEKCKFYYYCDSVLFLNDKLKEEEEKKHKSEVQK